jgi:hypothetical protein
LLDEEDVDVLRRGAPAGHGGAPGVQAQIVIGQSADLSGPVAASVKETILPARSW